MFFAYAKDDNMVPVNYVQSQDLRRYHWSGGRDYLVDLYVYEGLQRSKRWNWI